MPNEKPSTTSVGNRLEEPVLIAPRNHTYSSDRGLLNPGTAQIQADDQAANQANSSRHPSKQAIASSPPTS